MSTDHITVSSRAAVAVDPAASNGVPDRTRSCASTGHHLAPT
jgi:hypothetical protein